MGASGIYYSVNNALTANGSDYTYAMILTNFPAGVTLTIELYIKIGSTYYYGTSGTYSR